MYATEIPPDEFNVLIYLDRLDKQYPSVVYDCVKSNNIPVQMYLYVSKTSDLANPKLLVHGLSPVKMLAYLKKNLPLKEGF